MRDLLNLRQTIEPHREVLHELEEGGPQFFGADFADRGNVTVSTPLANDAAIFSRSTSSGGEKERWNSHHFVSEYRCLLRDELSGALQAAGCEHIRWWTPAESGFYQPIVLARRRS